MSIFGRPAIPPRGTAEFLHMAQAGLLPGISRMVISGSNLDIDSATTPEDLWGGTGLIPRPSGNESWEIVGGTQDGPAGTGCRTVSITTVDNSYISTAKVIAMNGETAVQIPGDCRFINIGVGLTFGSDGRPSQPLVIRIAGNGAVRAYIGVEGVLNHGKFTVPDNFRLEVHSALVGLRTDGVTQQSAVFNNIITNEAGRQLGPLRIPVFVGGQNPYRHEVAGGVVPFVIVQPRNEMTMRVTVTSSNNTQADISALALIYDKRLWPT